MSWDRRDWRLLPVALIALLLTYAPALRGTPVWDDAGHITRADLQPVEGLRRIWTEPGVTQQYYPLLHSAFWLEHRLWGDAPVGYHATNVALHAISAWLLWLVLKRLGAPGALLAAVIFALHPVQAESVAWITEQKNTLSGVFFLLSALAYLEFDESRRRLDYAAALGLFAAALLSKSVTAVLPAMLAAAIWWKRGRLLVRRDIAPLLPFTAVAAASGAATAWMEQAFFGASGAEFTLTPLERVLVAARATWFYAGTLIWPWRLSFNYPRWHVAITRPLEYVPLVAIVVVTVALWMMRRVSRGPLAAWLAFGFALAPALGFVNVYPFRYSFVADHFAYLAVMPFAAAFAAAVVRVAPGRRSATMAGAVIAVALGSLTFAESRSFQSEEALYRTTIERNPGSWFAHNNLGRLLLDRGDKEEARQQLVEAARLENVHAEPFANLGLLYVREGQNVEAIDVLREALRRDPSNAAAKANLARAEFAMGNDLQASRRIDAAIVHYRAALEVAPEDPAIHNNLGGALGVAGRFREAEAEFETALRLAPGYREAQDNLRRLRAIQR